MRRHAFGKVGEEAEAQARGLLSAMEGASLARELEEVPSPLPSCHCGQLIISPLHSLSLF